VLFLPQIMVATKLGAGNKTEGAVPSGVFRIWDRGHGERAEREPITGVWGRSPQWGPRAEPLVGGSGGEALLKLKHFLLFNV